MKDKHINDISVSDGHRSLVKLSTRIQWKLDEPKIVALSLVLDLFIRWCSSEYVFVI